MDAAFLKFWGDFLAQVAEGTRRWADLTRWMGGGFSASPDLSALFQSAYGLKPPAAGNPWQAKDWSDAAARFEKSWHEFMEAFQVVSRDRYEKLLKEKAALAEQVAAQERTIEKLRLELAQLQLSDGRVLDGFQQLMDVQQAQFRQVSENIERFLSSTPKKPLKSGSER